LHFPFVLQFTILSLGHAASAPSCAGLAKC
jgi:hypothetical protein